MHKLLHWKREKADRMIVKCENCNYTQPDAENFCGNEVCPACGRGTMT